ncbi:MAG: response regulator transcription factor [Limisphaerales bacterium]
MCEKAKHLVAVVDDDPSVCEATISLLKANGFGAESFCSAAEFLNSPQLDGARCLILDLQLSDMSGLELQRHLAGENRRIPVIYITAHGTPETREEAMRAGAIAFLSKPFSEEALLNSIRLALEN